ncbi:hypothetical protein [Streptacidiphilus cavernicola]|uniref:Uncharacterized protein n=1 Tax=Streptacidiphilus cavernicola TaxID=3342716 RepID=A0ABV6W4T0_9ACTN
MPIDFIGIDPDTGDYGSPTVWVHSEAKEILVQSPGADEELKAAIGGKAWVPVM